MPLRLPEARIQEALLHADLEVRLEAAQYFHRTSSRDEKLMPRVIQAVQQYGRQTAFPLLRAADRFVQTPVTIQWLTEELGRDCDLEDVETDNYCTALALILYHAPLELLAPGMVDLPCFPDELQEPFLDRLEMAAWDWEALWDALLALAGEMSTADELWMCHVRRKERIVEGLARHGGHEEKVLSVLGGSCLHVDQWTLEWLQPMVVDLAGSLRWDIAVPLLGQWLEGDDMLLSEHAHFALRQIGGDTVVRELARRWPGGSTDFRCSAAEILGYIPTDLAAEKVLQLLAAEEDPELKYALAHAALDLMIVDAVSPVRDLVWGEEAEEDEKDEFADERSALRARLVASATLLETTFPELESWQRQAVESGVYGSYVGSNVRIRQYFDEEATEVLEDGEGDAWDDEDYEDDRYEDLEADEDEPDDDAWDLKGLSPLNDLDDEPLDAQPVRNVVPRTGRNDPCPCGSGKKYKKCCLNKERNG